MDPYRRWILRAVVVWLLALVLVSCVPGDGDAGPTETSDPPAAQPTVEETATVTGTPELAVSPESSPETPVNIDLSTEAVIGSPVAPSSPVAIDDEANTGTVAGTPNPSPVSREQTATPETGAGTVPDASTATVNATPHTDAVGTPAIQGNTGTGTPAPEAGVLGIGDGTTGALSIGGTPFAGLGDQATPPPQGTPAPAGTPVASLAPLEVTSCDVEGIPEFTGDVTAYTLGVDLNFRSGPGADCDQIGDGPLGAFTRVEVVGGPVVRADTDDDFEWVQVQVGDSTGWLVLEFLEPAE